MPQDPRLFYLVALKLARLRSPPVFLAVVVRESGSFLFLAQAEGLRSRSAGASGIYAIVPLGAIEGGRGIAASLAFSGLGDSLDRPSS